MTKRLLAAALLFAIATPLHAGFADIARAIDSKKGVSRVWIPFLGIARVAVRAIGPEGVHDFQLVVFEGGDKLNPHELQQMMRTKVGEGFMPLVQVRSRRSNEWSFIYAKPHPNGKRFELVVLAHDDEDTVLVRVEVDADALARELNDSPRSVIHFARR